MRAVIPENGYSTAHHIHMRMDKRAPTTSHCDRKLSKSCTNLAPRSSSCFFCWTSAS